MPPPSSQPGDAGSSQRFPRLSVSHLLLLTLTVGFSLACIAPQIHDTLRMPDEVFRGRKWHSIAGTVAEYLSTGIKLFGLIVLTRQWLRGPSWPLAPGHWFLLVAGPIALFNMADDLATPLVREHWFSNHWKAFDAANHIIDASLLLASALVGVRAALATTDRRWRICLGILAVLLFDLTLLHAGKAIELSGYGRGVSFYTRHIIATWGNLHVSLALAILLAVSLEIATKTRRDWLHYLGLVAMFLDTVSIVLSFGPFLAKWWGDLFSHLSSWMS